VHPNPSYSCTAVSKAPGLMVGLVSLKSPAWAAVAAMKNAITSEIRTRSILSSFHEFIGYNV
jgi:hypothetical protein